MIKNKNVFLAYIFGAFLPLILVFSSYASWPEPLPLGHESMYADINQGEIAIADQMMNDYWPARGRPPVYIPRPLTWTEDPYDDAYWRFMFYSLRYTSNLLWAYKTTGKQEYLDRLLEIFSSFAAYDSGRPFNGSTFDNKHTSAYRAMILVNTYRKLEAWGKLPPGLAASLSSSIQRLGEFLVSSSNFEPGFNHGFNEAAALLLIADNFPQMNPSGTWQQTALTRLLNMLGTNIDADGVDIENSPFYHYYVMGMVSQIAAWAASWEPGISNVYTNARQRMVHHAAMIVQPDGRLPMLGATATTNVPAQDPAVYGPLTVLDANFAWVFTKGSQGQPPASGVELFPVCGLFLLRSTTPSNNELMSQTFITFDSGIYRTDHSHLDALSITYYSHGAELLPDSGLFTYDHGTDFNYFHGTRSHNTVVVDGKEQLAGTAIPGKSGRIGPSAWATGTSSLYPGIIHCRTVILVERGLAVIVDSLSSNVSHDYVQTWHVMPNTSLQTLGKNIVAKRSDGTPILAISQADWSTLSLVKILGATSPMQGWYSIAYGSKNPNWAIEYKRQASSARFVTLIASGPYASAQPWIQQAWITGQNRRKIWIQAGSKSYTLTLIAQGSSTESLMIEQGLVR